MRVHNEWYVEPEQARAMLEARKDVRRKVEDYWWQEQGVEIPEVLRSRGQNNAILARHVPTFRYEDAVFAIMSERAGLQPVWLGYINDVSFGASPVKNSLLAPLFVNRIGRNGGREQKKVKLARIASCEGRALSTISCNRNGSQEVLLPDFHLKLLKKRYPGAQTGDASVAWRALGGKAHFYYPAFLSLALAHGVLFEDYHGGESGDELGGFTSCIFEPSFREVEERFGVKPLVVRLPWWKELALYPGDPLTEAISWRCHGFALKQFTTPNQNGNAGLVLS